MSFVLHGLPVSGGIAIGQAHLMSHATLEVSHLVIAPRLVDKEIARFESALLRVREEFATLKGRMQHSSAEFGAFIDLHSMILDDPELAEAPKELILDLDTLPGMPDKIEGMTILDWNTIAIANDNDFDIGPAATCGTNVGTGAKSKILIIDLKKSLFF